MLFCSVSPIKKWPWLRVGTLPSTSPAAEKREEESQELAGSLPAQFKPRASQEAFGQGGRSPSTEHGPPPPKKKKASGGMQYCLYFALLQPVEVQPLPTSGEQDTPRVGVHT